MSGKARKGCGKVRSDETRSDRDHDYYTECCLLWDIRARQVRPKEERSCQKKEAQVGNKQVRSGDVRTGQVKRGEDPVMSDKPC